MWDRGPASLNQHRHGRRDGVPTAITVPAALICIALSTIRSFAGPMTSAAALSDDAGEIEDPT
ncbi:hypothetical protein C487_14539 [Natrinema pallidum DSM 3751]|uniref:Uncharacterized protein n=1 Tax=Natrinema pallidum DSM 3751 TaxID=1227495 RepID=L9YKR7_9EURY|nr:hypothetical protein C487_14539 [Natrinema pallidum DSM 3751]